MNLDNDISKFAKATLKENLILALGEQNINTQITNPGPELSEEFKKNYGALKSKRTVVIANAEKILASMRNEHNSENDAGENGI